MKSNTKLSLEQKAQRKDMLKELKYNASTMGVHAFIGTFGAVTICAMVHGAHAEYSVAICSQDEKKNRPKVGEFHALARWQSGARSIAAYLGDDDEFVKRMARAIDPNSTTDYDSGYRFDSAGFDVDGFDVDGFDVDGIDRDGYDRDGFGSDGFNVDGFDVDGFDFGGFDSDGFDRDGFDSDGFDRDGFDSNGDSKPE